MSEAITGALDPARISDQVAAMSLSEKVSLLAGATFWTTASIERLGVPAITVTDGPNGARGGGPLVGGAITSACFPAAISLAATWNTGLVERIGRALAEEAKTKGAHLLLAPTVNIHRSPLNGRNFECFSEDPYLSAEMAVAYINGVQGEGVGAVVKHFVGNDSEFERNSISSEIGERTLREIYLPPFEAAVREAGVWAVMSAYNKVNGVFAGEHRELLIDLLKHEWGFGGVVMSDWFGTNSTADAANNGLDLEMPGPPRWRGARLVAAVEAGDVDPAAVDEAARRVLGVVARTGAVAGAAPVPERAEDRPEHRALIREAAAEGIVLLKNSGILPLDAGRLASLAIVGPNATSARIHGGGSAQVNAHYAVSPLDGIAARAGARVEIGYELGATNHKLLPRLEPSVLAEGAFAVAFFPSGDLSGEPIPGDATTSAEQMWFGPLPPGVDRDRFSVRLSATFTPQESGQHAFSVASAGLGRLILDGRTLVDNWSSQTPGDTYFGLGSTEVVATLDLEAGASHDLIVEYGGEGGPPLKAIRLGHLPPVPEDAIARAAALAARSDVAVLCVGLNGDWDSEGADRPHMDMVGEQNALIAAVAAANPNTVVVLQSGGPLAMPWLDEVAAVIQAWYPGQECGNAIADVLFGDVNPSGKLSQTFPVRLEDNPAFPNYPGEGGRVRYEEGVFVGYRHYERAGIAPLFPFGFGMSYTAFTYANVRLDRETMTPDRPLVVVMLDVANTGDRFGQETVQLYVRDPDASVPRPEQELKGFVKFAAGPGDTVMVSLPLDPRALAYWDDTRHAWVAEAGEYEALIGASSADIRGRVSFRLTETIVVGGPGEEGGARM